MEVQKDPLGRTYSIIGCERACKCRQSAYPNRVFYIINSGDVIRSHFSGFMVPCDAPCVVVSCVSCGFPSEDYCYCCDTLSLDGCAEVDDDKSVCRLCLERIKKKQESAPPAIRSFLNKPWADQLKGCDDYDNPKQLDIIVWLRKAIEEARKKNHKKRDRRMSRYISVIRNKQ